MNGNKGFLSFYIGMNYIKSKFKLFDCGRFLGRRTENLLYMFLMFIIEITSIM